MPLSRFLELITARARKCKPLLWLMLVTGLMGVTAFAEPLDLALLTLRNKIRAQPVSSEVVIVGIDDESVATTGPWPWKRDRLAALTDRLFSAGADRIFFDLYLPPLDAAGDRAFAEVLARHPGAVFLASTNDYSADGKSRVLEPSSLGSTAEVVSTMKFLRYWNGVPDLVYREVIGNKVRRSIEAAIAEVDGPLGSRFPVDYSYQLSSIPYTSATDVLAGRSALDVKGRSVVVGLNSKTLSTRLAIPGQGHATSVFVTVLGAETLKTGRPAVLGWWPLWLLAAGISAVLLYGRKHVKWAVGLPGVAALLVLPLVLEYVHVFVDVAPALLLTAGAALLFIWQQVLERRRMLGLVHPVSGLPTVNAMLRREDLVSSELLIAARVRRFADIVSTLPPDFEHELTKLIASRLSIGTTGAQLWHGDDGNFVWLTNASELELVVDQFKAMQLIFRSPIKVAERSYDVDVAFGIDRETAMPMSHRLASALAAAHAASEEGVCWMVHDPATAKAKEWKLSLLGELDDALEAGHIWVAYQPQLDLRTAVINGAEALVRWTHPVRGPISPMDFIEIAERNGRIGKVTAFVLDRAGAVTRDVLRRNPAFRMSVNLSPSELSSRMIVDVVRSVLARYQIPADALVLEITETAAIAEGETALATLSELRMLGIGIAIDDYGTGMSTLEYLRKIPATELKIDRRFTNALLNGPADRAVMVSTIELAHILGLEVVAEGIETPEQLFALAQIRCDRGQGYHIARPMEDSDLKQMIDYPARVKASR
jgi:EAL domain-containing protein (putative c-di-GMP-specific phosphodiesterase class I)/CHASE2 domain-containing sensor protein